MQSTRSIIPCGGLEASCRYQTETDTVQYIALYHARNRQRTFAKKILDPLKIKYRFLHSMRRSQCISLRLKFNISHGDAGHTSHPFTLFGQIALEVGVVRVLNENDK